MPLETHMLLTPPQFLTLRRFLVELIVRYALGIFFAIGAGTHLHAAFTDLAFANWANLQPHEIGHILSVTMIGLYTALIACLYIIRLPPRSAFPGVLPAFAAIAGGFLMGTLLFLTPRENLSLEVQTLSCVLVVAGIALATYVLFYLGRSFSILPESRRLVMRGPYRIVRHPLYVAEAIASTGMVLVFLSPLAVAILLVHLAWQLVRIKYEEKVLTETFPEYKDYARHTYRLLPGVY